MDTARKKKGRKSGRDGGNLSKTNIDGETRRMVATFSRCRGVIFVECRKKFFNV